MAITHQHGAPGVNVIQEGKFASNRTYQVVASALTPVSATNMDYIIAVDVDDGAPDTMDIFQQGGGNERSVLERGWKWSGTITVHKGKMPYVLSQLLNVTWDTGNDAVIPFKIPDDFPHVHWEAICREKDNTTHLFTLVIQDMIIEKGSFSNPLDAADGTIPFHTYYPPCYLSANAELVYDVWTGDASTVDFTPSSTPLNLLTAADHDDFLLAQAFSIKEKASTASTGTRQMSGYSYGSSKFTATTAPAASTLVQILYARIAA